jgi:hypothetical protein
VCINRREEVVCFPPLLKLLNALIMQSYFEAMTEILSTGIFEETAGKYKVDKLLVMMKFMAVVESNPDKAQSNLNKFNSFVVSQIKRGITPQENVNIITGFYNYIRSDAATKERTDSMDYMINLKFLED